LSEAREGEGEFVPYSQLTHALCAAVSDDDGLSEGAARKLLRDGQELAERNEVASIVAHAAMRALGPEEVPAVWRDGHSEVVTRITSRLAELDRLAARFASEGMAVVALKNGGIARAIYPCPGCCPMGDLDLLVDRKNFRTAHEILLSEDYILEFRSPLQENRLEAAERSGGGEYRKTMPDGDELWIEVQWRPISGRWIRPDQEPRASDLLIRSLTIPGSDARLLAPEDNLLQVAVHTAKHSYVRAPGFRLHTDVDRIVRRQPIDWRIFLNLVRSLQVRTAVYFSLAIPHEIFATPVPAWVLRELEPSPWKEQLMRRWIRRAGVLDPQEVKFGKLEYVCFTALLYDDLTGLVRALLPERRWMQAHYGFTRPWMLPAYYARRAFELAFRRVSP
jgi:hypothetical protein